MFLRQRCLGGFQALGVQQWYKTPFIPVIPQHHDADGGDVGSTPVCSVRMAFHVYILRCDWLNINDAF